MSDNHVKNLRRLSDVLFQLDYQQMGAEARLAAEEIERLRSENHEIRGLLETAIDARDSQGSVSVAWYEHAREIVEGAG